MQLQMSVDWREWVTAYSKHTVITVARENAAVIRMHRKNWRGRYGESRAGFCCRSLVLLFFDIV